MVIFLYIVHVIAALTLMVVILLQSGKGGGLGSGFGGAAASATKIFGGGGTTNFLGRLTVIIATIFMATSLSLAYFSSHEESVMDLNSKDGADFSSQEDQIIEEGGTGGSSAINTIDQDSDAPAADDAAANPTPIELQPVEAPEGDAQPEGDQDSADAPRGPGNPEGPVETNE